MRVRLVALASLAMAAALPAHAADFPVLRGTHTPLPPAPEIAPATGMDWNGLYLGGYGSWQQTTVRARNTVSPLINAALAGTPYAVLNPGSAVTSQNRTSRSTGFGAFVGYNVASEDALLGLEADFGWLNSKTNVARIGAPVSSPAIGEVRIFDAAATTRLDYVTSFRARAGLIYGNLMPYVTGGFAWGSAKLTNSADFGVYAPPLPGTLAGRFAPANTRNVIMAGYTLGAGLEARFGGLLVRGEYLYTTLENSRAGRVDINQARVGAGVAF